MNTNIEPEDNLDLDGDFDSQEIEESFELDKPEVKEEIEDDKEEEDITEEVVEESEEKEVTEEVEESTVSLLVDDLTTKLGLDFTPEELEEFSDDSIESVTKLVELSTKKAVILEREAFYEKHPDLKQAQLYKEVHGSLKGFGEQVSFPDYTELDLTSEDNQKMIYTKFLELKGTEPDEIKDLLELAEEKNLLEKKSEVAKEKVVKYYEAQNAKITKDLEDAKLAEKAEWDSTVTKVTELVKGGKILGMTLTKKEQSEFMDYLTKPVDKQGRTAKEIMDESLSLDKEIAIELLKMKDFKILQGEIKKATVEDLNKRKVELKKRVAPMGDSKNKLNSSKAEVEIDFSKLDR